MAFQDTFDGGSQVSLTSHDANWIQMLTGGTAVRTAGGLALGSANPALYRYAGLGYTDQVAKLTLDTGTAAGGPMVRCAGTAAGNNEVGYFAYWTGSVVRIYKRAPGSNTQKGSDSSAQTFAAGDTLELRATGSGTVTLTAHKNGGSAIVTTSDTSSTYDTGDPGIYFNSIEVRTFDADTIGGGGGGVFTPFFFGQFIGRQP